VTDIDPELEALLKASENWTPQAKATALEMYRLRSEGVRVYWYCKPEKDAFGNLIVVEAEEEYVDDNGDLAVRTVRQGVHGRWCDGKPHGTFNYPHARADQWPPVGTEWFVWALMGGRGSGKTRTGAEYVRRLTEKVGRLALLAPTNSDVREVMITGESGLINVFGLAGEKIDYQPSRRRIIFPSGCIGSLYSGEEPDRLRGPQHGAAWMDEPSHYDQLDEVWDNLLFGLRLGDRPHVVVTTTPLPNKWTKTLIKDPTTKLSRVSTYANLDNLAPSFRQRVIDRYEGTRTGRQELYGDILEDVLGALWSSSLIKQPPPDAPVKIEDLERILVSIDPAGSANRRSDETGIVATGKIADLGYVVRDKSDKYSPQGWGMAAIRMYEELAADAIVVERNYGGDMVRDNLKTLGFEGRIIENNASRGKQVRAEPISARYEQGKMFHLGTFEKLEEEMTTWIPGVGASPNRVDAMVWGFAELFGSTTQMKMASPLDLPDDNDPLNGRFML